MKTRPISYKKQMILAKKNGWKTVTRRPMKQLPNKAKVSSIQKGVAYFKDDIVWDDNPEAIECPYGKPGDQLWTREGYIIEASRDKEPIVTGRYTADDELFVKHQLTNDEWEKFKDRKYSNRKTPGRFMYKSLSRFRDEVREIGVERIQDISAEEIYNEGIRIAHIGGEQIDDIGTSIQYRGLFKCLWQTMYEGGPYDWQNNPWVWVVRYKPITVNNKPVNAN